MESLLTINAVKTDMRYINAPLKECECCNGVGVIDDEVFAAKPN